MTGKVVEKMTEWRDRPLERGRSLALVANQLVMQAVFKCVVTSSCVWWLGTTVAVD